jgi:hypothetical protein
MHRGYISDGAGSLWSFATHHNNTKGVLTLQLYNKKTFTIINE